MEKNEKIFQVKNPRLDLQYISKHVEVGVDKYFGRFVYATAKLSAGDVISIEEPFFKSLDIRSGNKIKRCANCLRRCENSYACHNCNSVDFCSQQCKDKASELHEKECHLLAKIDEDDGYFLLMMRMLMKSINICGSLNKFMQFSSNRDKNSTIFNANSNFDFGLLNCCLNLQCGNFLEDIKFAKSFVESETMKKLYDNDSQKFFLVKTILKILGILNRNSFCLEFDDGNACGAVFPFASLLNNSCSPNVDRISDGCKTAFVCIRPIEKNEQLFICYRYS